MDGITDGGNNKAFAPLGQIKDVAVVGQRLAHGQVGYPTTIGVDEVLEGLGVVWVMCEFEGNVVPAAGGLELQMLDGILTVVVLTIKGFNHGRQESSRAYMPSCEVKVAQT